MKVIQKIDDYLLLEGVSQPRSFQDLELLLKKYCKPYLKEMGPNWKMYPMFRGIKGKTKVNNALKMFETKKNRKPKDTPIVVNNIFNEEFYDIHNVKNIRDQAIYVIGNATDAGMYGNVYVIFPIGKFTYWWSPKILDFFGWVQANIPFSYEGSRVLKPKTKFDEDSLKEYREDIKYIIQSYKNKDLKIGLYGAPISRRTEVMLLCDKYFALDYIYFKKLINHEL